MFALAMMALAITPSATDDAKTAATTRLPIQSLQQLKDDLDKHTYLRDRYIIFPHVGEGGQFSLLRKGMAAKYAEMPCVGGYLDGEITKLGFGNRDIVDGKNKEWGNKRVAVFQTSDNRHEDHHKLGLASTWVKWAVPKAEALRQACLAQESRVSQETPKFPSVVVAGISVSNSVFLGPIEIDLNPQYNALIGGRGTGKSTVLEYLRWALCDQPPGIADNNTPNYQARRGRLIEQTLKPVDAIVQVRFEVNGVPHVVRRDSRDGSLLIKIANDVMRACTEEEVRMLLPIQAYSQKQLSDVSVRVEELLRFITAPIRAELGRVERQATDQVERISQLYATRRRQRSLAQTLHKRKLEERSLTEQVDTLRAALTGLSEEDQMLLDRGKVFDTADRSVQSWQDRVNSFREKATNLQLTINSYLTRPESPPMEPEDAILKAAHDEYHALLTEAKTTFDALIERANAITTSTLSTDAKSPWRQWSEKMMAFKTSYEAAVQHSSAHGEKMKQLKDIEEQLSKHVRETARVRDELRNLAAVEAGYKAERDAWELLLREHDDLLDGQCEGLTDRSGGAIRAHVKRYADAVDFVNGLRQSLSGSRVPGAKIEALGEFIVVASDAGAQWNAILSDLEKLAEFDAEQDSTEQRPGASVLSAAGLSAGDLDRIATTLKPEAWLGLSLMPIKSEPVFEYRTRESEYISFRNASAGQQATALLKTLLNEAGPPLIIDQPEEDLDNPVMLDIVQQVWQAKKSVSSYL